MMMVETLTPASVEENVALARGVGWPDDTADWGVIHETALVLGVRRAERLIAQGALISYAPRAGTIAKMNVAPDAQRQGLGAKILDELIVAAEARGITALGLVATPFGQALYESRGFVTSDEVAIFIGAARRDDRARFVSPIDDVAAAIAFERDFVACDRGAMLRGRLREANASAICLHPNGSLRGFAIATPKPAASHTQIGPLVAEDESTARELVLGILAKISGEIRIDVPLSQPGFRAWLGTLGLPEKGVRPEMTRGAALPWQVRQRFSLATAAWG